MDFTRGTSLFVAAVTLIVGAANDAPRLGNFELGGVGTFGAIILSQLLKLAPTSADEEALPSAEWPEAT